MFEMLFEEGKLFNMSWIDSHDLLELIFRFLFNFFWIFVIVRLLYYPTAKRKDYLFTYFMISLMVFFICFLLDNVKLQLGFALGLFAIFGIIRYRTSQIPIKEMTYLFLIIGLSVVNALANKKISYAELIFTNFMAVVVIFFLERVWFLKHESRKTIVYEKINLILPEHRAELLADLEKRTGLEIHRIEVGRINFLQDTARIRIFYFEREPNSADDYDSFSNNNDSE